MNEAGSLVIIATLGEGGKRRAPGRSGAAWQPVSMNGGLSYSMPARSGMSRRVRSAALEPRPISIPSSRSSSMPLGRVAQENGWNEVAARGHLTGKVRSFCVVAATAPRRPIRHTPFVRSKGSWGHDLSLWTTFRPGLVRGGFSSASDLREPRHRRGSSMSHGHHRVHSGPQDGRSIRFADAQAPLDINPPRSATVRGTLPPAAASSRWFRRRDGADRWSAPSSGSSPHRLSW